MLNHTPLRISFEKEFSAGCQPRYPVKIPITTWKSLSPPRGLQLYPSCQARCPAKTSNAMEIYPAPSTAQLLTMLLHREHFCSYLYYTQFGEKINYNKKNLPIMYPAFPLYPIIHLAMPHCHSLPFQPFRSQFCCPLLCLCSFSQIFQSDFFSPLPHLL